MVKVTVNSIKSVEANIITGSGFWIQHHSQEPKSNLQKTTGNIYQTTTEQLMTPVLCSKWSNCRFRVSGPDAKLYSARIFLGLFSGYAKTNFNCFNPPINISHYGHVH